MLRPLLLALVIAAMTVPTYPDRSNLLVVREGGGPERPVRTAAEWSLRRQQVLANMQRVMGDLPTSRPALDVRVEREEDADKYRRRHVTYVSVEGERVPAYLLIPTGGGKHPAMLCLHQTNTIGKDETVGLGGGRNLAYGQELAERGYVVLAPDYPTFGEHRIDLRARGWASGSMKAIYDNIRGIDLLRSLPEVDGKRIGCIGHSLGGHNTLFTAAFDTRIRAAVSSCGFTAFGKYYGGDLTGWTSDRYMPRIRTEFPTPDRMPFDFHEVVAAVAPRAFLVIAPQHDANFDAGGVREVVAAAAPVYQLLGHREHLAAEYPDCAHDFPPEMRQRAYAWLDRWLKQR